MPRRLAVAAILVALAGAPAGALAQGSPFTPIPPAPAPAPPAPPPPGGQRSSDDGGLSGWQTALIFVAGGILLLGIGYAIVADARQKAPVDLSPTAAAGRRQREEHSERAKRQARRKQKAARAQRRRNR
jgi:hypothetical protein